MDKDIKSSAALNIGRIYKTTVLGSGRNSFIIKGEMKMKPYKFMALYKKNKEDKWKEFDKFLYLNPEEVKLTGENYGLKFFDLMVERGALPKGFYDEIRLYEWKTKEKC